VTRRTRRSVTMNVSRKNVNMRKRGVSMTKYREITVRIVAKNRKNTKNENKKISVPLAMTTKVIVIVIKKRNANMNCKKCAQMHTSG